MKTKVKAVEALRAGPNAWNAFAEHYRKEHPDTSLDLSDQDLTGIYFDGPSFLSDMIFDRCIFDCPIMRCNFSADASFRGAIFRRDVKFATSHSYKQANFDGAVFDGVPTIAMLHSAEASFIGTLFKNGLLSRGSRQNQYEKWGTVIFDDAIFAGPVMMTGENFQRGIFRRAKFEGSCSFANSEFFAGVDFADACFNAVASFENVKFLASSSFLRSRFAIAPNFHNADLHQGTVFSPADQFPHLFIDTKSPEASEAYRTLKLAMNRQHALSEELGFFLLEMRSRAHTEGWAKRVLYAFYDALSRYGLSVKRPLAWFICVNFAFGLTYSWLSGQKWETIDYQLLALTLFGSFPFAAALRWPEVTPNADTALFHGHAVALAQVAIVAQSVLSAVLLFLIGLGLRNMFKIK